MKGRSMPFDHRPDPELGDALRQALSADDHSTFVARVMAAVATPQHPVHWDILASWARRGAGAACAAGLGAALLVGAMHPAPVDLVVPVAGPSARVLMATVTPPNACLLLVPEDVR